MWNELSFRQKTAIGIIGFLVFWFYVFYPKVLPYFNSSGIHPFFGTVIYESLFFVTIWLVTVFIFGEAGHQSRKMAILLFLVYHIFDAIEPPFIVNPTGQVDSAIPSAVISWDYGVGSVVQSITGLGWDKVYYITNIGVLVILALLIVHYTKPQLLGRIMRKVLG